MTVTPPMPERFTLSPSPLTGAQRVVQVERTRIKPGADTRFPLTEQLTITVESPDLDDCALISLTRDEAFTLATAILDSLDLVWQA